MSTRKLTMDEFSEKYYEENEYGCYCSATDMPPCAHCEGAFLEGAYEEYLENYEEENKNE